MFFFVQAVLDREEKSRYSLTVTARDNGRPRRLSASMPITVHVLDTNDNTPVFQTKVSICLSIYILHIYLIIAYYLIIIYLSIYLCTHLFIFQSI